MKKLEFSKAWPDRMGEWGLNQETYFHQKIVDGRKKHTIREDKRQRWEIGVLIDFQHPDGKRFIIQPENNIVKSIQTIEIQWYELEYPMIFIDERCICDPVVGVFMGVDSDDTLYKLARNNGFLNIEQFLCYFNEDFKGKLIHWTDLKY